ncbi:energy-coupling factor ABC transporter substrate-binding protein [Epidermidibacterium keratini]|uniref:Cobalt transport protein CbiN n=1 Tax=Epidermidibacterium keratini TaxID=1891644 RepID=A0A7L4YLD2_9ACTN|nr:energy-coupling factor ABC transporter substrate-binding protein [Epidermidibacterium keratini]QHB99861.1 energy-coupling factor ABC transporter substrate-binding protein [Epidermidibacterium keratini]
MSKRTTTLLLFVALIIVVGAAYFLGSARSGPADERFAGADSKASELIDQTNPDYQPWAQNVFTPSSSELESGLFAIQAAIGAGVVGYAVGVLRSRRKIEQARDEGRAAALRDAEEPEAADG